MISNAALVQDDPSPRRIGLVSCTKSKLPHAAAARDLYSPSALFRAQRTYVESTCARWFILSAKYGLVDPDQVIEPYEQTLRTISTAARRAWSADVLTSLIDKLGEIRGVTFECHAGSAYLDCGVVQGIAARGGLIERPAEKLTLGRRLSFYKQPRNIGAANQRPVSCQGDLVVTAAPVPTRSSPGDTRHSVIDALLAFGATLDNGHLVAIGPDPDSDRLIRDDGFAFLLAVIFDQGIAYERAWRAPFELKQRLGNLDPAFFVAHPAAVRAAVARPPALHRFINNMSRWLVNAASRVIDHYGGDAERIWRGRPSAHTLRQRLDAFAGIGQKKAAMAVEILERQRGVEITHLEGSDIAFDIHVRRVFLRSGLADRDDQNYMVEAARRLHPDRPGALDYPAWWVGHEWCRPIEPLCDACPISQACPQLKDRARSVR